MRPAKIKASISAGVSLVMALLSGCAIGPVSNAEQRPHAYAFSQPELLSAQRVFGIGNATMLLGLACDAFPEAAASYAQWEAENHRTMEQLTTELAEYYQIKVAPEMRRERVAQAMHLKTSLDLSQSALDEACPTLPATLAQSRLNLQQRMQESIAEVSEPNYLKFKSKIQPGNPAADAVKETP